MVKKNSPLARLRLQKRRHRHTIQTKSERTQGYELLHIWEMYLLLAFLIFPSEYEHGYIFWTILKPNVLHLPHRLHVFSQHFSIIMCSYIPAREKLLLVEMCHNVICPSGAPIRPVQLENIGESIYNIHNTWGNFIHRKWNQFLKRTRWGRKYSKEMFSYRIQKQRVKRMIWS